MREGQRRRESDRWGPSTSNNRNWSLAKPPRIPDENFDTRQVPAWEKKFVLANRICWGKLVETKQFLHQYPAITSWDDSAGQEAFENAKARFWAEMNRLQPKTPLPDPDLFIDRIDHDAPPTDAKLCENLCGSISDEERDSNDDKNSDEWSDGGVILWDSHYSKDEEEEVTGWGDTQTGWGENHPIVPTGWGDIPMQQPTLQTNVWGVIPTSWGNNPVNPTGWANIPGDTCPETTYNEIIPTGWGDNPVNPTGWADVAGDTHPETTYREIIPTGWGDFEGLQGPWNGGVADANYWSSDVNNGNCVGWSQNNGYGYRSGEAGQHWNYSGAYLNSSASNGRNWDKCTGEHVDRNDGNRNGASRSGWNKSRNKNYKGKQWRRRKDDFGKNANSDNRRYFCAPLDQPTQNNDSWNVPRTVT